jgi:acetyltransferase-like isoleucine patch superfamily enzyme
MHQIIKTLKEWERERQWKLMFPYTYFEENVQIKSPHLLTLGRNVVIQKGCVLHCGGMDWSDGRGLIKIGDDSVISPYCILYGAGDIEIGKRFDCGPGCMIFSFRSDYSISGSEQQKQLFGKISIGDDVILYANCIISPGVRIEDGAVLAAGSVVLNNVPSQTFYAGIPASKIKDRL